MKNRPVKSMNWLRSRQEKTELGYWLSFAAYDLADRSFLNQAYLLYLVTILAGWLFVMLVLIAKYGAMILTLINPSNPVYSAVGIEIFALILWNLYGVGRSMAFSPLVFSEQDQSILCQTPASPARLVLRWMWMPWMKSALLFGLMAVMLGFSVAETHLNGSAAAQMLPLYFRLGGSALLLLLPLQLALFALQWTCGVMRLRGSAKRNWMRYPVLAIMAFLSFLFVLSMFANAAGTFHMLARPLLQVLTLGLSGQNIILSFIVDILVSLVFIVLLVGAASRFSLIRAAQETTSFSLLDNARRYGFTDFADQHRQKQHLGPGSSSYRLTQTGEKTVQYWKNSIRARRGFRWSVIFQWFSIFAISIGLPLLPTVWNRMLALLFWVVQLTPLLSRQLRADLSSWTLTRLLPNRKKDVLLAGLFSDIPLVLLLGAVAFCLSALITRTFPLGLFISLPGMLVSVHFLGVIDILHKSQSEFLVSGKVPSVGVLGTLLGLVGSAIPVFFVTLLPGIAGALMGLISSLFIAWIAYGLAVHFYRSIR